MNKAMAKFKRGNMCALCIPPAERELWFDTTTEEKPKMKINEDDVEKFQTAMKDGL